NDSNTDDVARLTGPRLTAIDCGADVSAWPPIVAVIVLAPAIVPVNVAVWVASWWLGTAASVRWPPVGLPSAKATVKPPTVSLLPAASRACSVTVTPLPDTSLADESEANDVVRSTGPGVTAIAGAVEVTDCPPIVAVIELAPAIVPVNVAV